MLKTQIAKNWKTTTVGTVVATSMYITMFPADFPERAVNLAKFVNIGGLASFGIVSKDAKDDEETN